MASPLPTIVYVRGGPFECICYSFRDDSGGAYLTLAARGYAVLIANHRGRPGWGREYAAGMRDGPSAFRLPLDDVIAGLDYLVSQGISDPHRLGLYGHSYGGSLTQFALTQTDRFRAAIDYEGFTQDWVAIGASYAPANPFSLTWRDLYGVRDPYNPLERARMIAESPLWNADHASTPLMMLHGRNPLNDGRPFLNALRRFNVPALLFEYDAGHRFENRAQADAFTRIGEWFDYWVRGMPFPNAGRAAQYDSWRSNPRVSDPDAWVVPSH